MVALLISPLYALIHFWLIFRMLKWMKICGGILARRDVRIGAAVVYIALALAILAGYLVKKDPARRVLKVIGDDFFGVTLYLILTVGTVRLIRLILLRFPSCAPFLAMRPTQVLSGILCVAITACVCILGAWNARVIHTTRYDVTVAKPCGTRKELRVALAADLHLGYHIGCAQTRQMVDRINELEPDLVILAGDIFDNDFDALDDPEALAEILRGIRSRYGVYACWGNHDVQEDLLAGFSFFSKDQEKKSDRRMDEFLQASNIRMLADEGVLIDGSFCLYGREDLSVVKKNKQSRKTASQIMAEMDSSLPILVIDHEPGELEELADAGADVDFGGHTHNGQLFPGTLSIKLLWKNSCGYRKEGAMHSIVTSGVGLYGPNMRVGCIAEICDVHISFQ